jgi:hypothetical protein
MARPPQPGTRAYFEHVAGYVETLYAREGRDSIAPARRQTLDAKLADARTHLAALRPSVPCRACGTALTDPLSVAAQIGPCCARKAVAA